MAELRVAVVGDSAMWGQGLDRIDSYAVKAAIRIGKLVGKDPKIRHLTARSGANIDVYRNNIERGRKQREYFADTYPEIIPENMRTAFIQGDQIAEALAGNLFGETPATFPTVLNQVESD